MKYQFKTTPYKHQVKALKHLVQGQGGALFMEMGTGKTKVAIDYACALGQAGKLTRVLVVCGKSVMGVWNGEIPKHATHDLEWHVINYDKVWRSGTFEEIALWLTLEPSMVIVDESHKIKNPTAKRSKALHGLGKRAQYRVLLSGTPISKNPLDLFSQFKFLDESIFGTRWTHFKKRYAIWGGYGGYELLRYQNLRELKKKIQPYTFRVKKEDCLDLPNRTHTLVPVVLEREKAVYNEMAAESIVEFEGQEATAPIVLTRLLRLSQITGGHLRSDDGKDLQVGDSKQRVLADLLEDLHDQGRTKVVVFTRFLHDLRVVRSTARDAGYHCLALHGSVPQELRERRIAAFEETKSPTVFAAQIATGAEGISLTAASEAIFYSHTYSWGEFDQACARLHRIGQHHAVTYYHLIATDTVDELVWMALRTKRDLADLVLRNTNLLK